MAAYPECYLDEIVETQGKLFEYVADKANSQVCQVKKTKTDLHHV